MKITTELLVDTAKMWRISRDLARSHPYLAEEFLSAAEYYRQLLRENLRRFLLQKPETV
jgi:hypothetical protein